MSIFRKIYVFVKRKIRVYSKKRIAAIEKQQLKSKKIVIISDNCWGGAVYQWYDRPYNSPFVGMGIYGDCYIKLLSNFDEYMQKELVFKSQEESKYPYKFRDTYYPMGMLDDVEIHFTHFKTEEEVLSKWIRRTKRMLEEKNRNNFYFKICDSQRADEETFKKFHELPFKNKISFVKNDKKTLHYNNHIGIVENRKGDKTRVPNGVKLFKISFLYFNLTNWLLNNQITRTTFKS